MTKRIFATDGRRMGHRALATQRRLLDATTNLLNDIGILDLKVVDIARSIDTSPATFYQYFSDVDAVLLMLAEEATADEEPLVAFLKPGWTRADGMQRALEFVDAYTSFWDAHRGILRVRNLKAEEGDARFRAVRSTAHMLLIEAFDEMVSVGVADGRLSASLHPFTTGAALVAMLERILAFQSEMAKRGADRRAIRETLATLLFETLTGGSHT